jgi:hypothetical protein
MLEIETGKDRRALTTAGQTDLQSWHKFSLVVHSGLCTNQILCTTLIE